MRLASSMVTHLCSICIGTSLAAIDERLAGSVQNFKASGDLLDCPRRSWAGLCEPDEQRGRD
jgi:hypothetical protein